MRYELHPRQRVIVQYDNVYFCHRTQSGQRRDFMLTPYQLENLTDILDGKLTIRSYPLGDSVWLTVDPLGKRLVNHRNKAFFWFYSRSWDMYKRQVHPKLMSFLHHAAKHQDYQYDADDESEPCYQSRNRARKRRWKATLRSSRNARPNSEQWEEHTTFSRRNHSDSRMHSRRYRRKHARRSHPSPPTVRQDDNSDITSNKEHCSIDSVDESTLPTLEE